MAFRDYHAAVPELQVSGFARVPDLAAAKFLAYQDGLRASNPEHNAGGLSHWSRGWEYCYAIHGVREFIAHERLTNPTAMESGCGLTPVPFTLAGHGVRVTGADLDPALPDQWKAHAWPTFEAGGSADFTVGDIEKLPFPDGAFDIGYSVSAIEHTSDPEKATAELCRVVRPGGLVLFTCDVEPQGIGIPYAKFERMLKVLDEQTVFGYPPRWCHPSEVLTFASRPGGEADRRRGPVGHARATLRDAYKAFRNATDTVMAIYGTARVKK